MSAMRKCLNIGFTIIQVWQGHQIRNNCHWQDSFHTHRSQEEGALHALGGYMEKHQGLLEAEGDGGGGDLYGGFHRKEGPVRVSRLRIG